MPAAVFSSGEANSHQRSRRGQQRQNVAGQLIGGEREEHEDENKPCNQQSAARVAPCSGGERNQQQRRPRSKRRGDDGKIIPKRMWVAEKIAHEPAKMVLHKKFLQKHAAVSQIAEKIPGE